MNEPLMISGVVTGAPNGRVTIRDEAGTVLDETAVEDGAYALTIAVSDRAIGPDDETLRAALPLLFDEALAPTAPEVAPVQLALHALQQSDPWTQPFSDDDALASVVSDAVLEIAVDEHVVHRHRLRLTRRLQGEHVSIDVVVEPPQAELGYVTPSNGLPDSFDGLPHQDKLDILWRRCEEASVNYRPEQQGWLSLVFGGPQALRESRLREGLADVPASAFQRPYDLTQPRRKVVHQIGAVGKVRFEPKPSPYSGLFAAPCGGLLRCSSSLYTKRYFIPGIALKLPVSGQHSRNLVGLVSMQGQGNDHRFFLGEMVTDTPTLEPAPNTPAFWASMLYRAQASIAKQSLDILRKAARPGQPNVLPLAPFAAVTVDGQSVAEVVTPDRLRLLPTVAVQAQWPDDDQHFFDKLNVIHPGTTLYEVVAESNRFGSTTIGSLILDSRLILSRVGDEQLHFGHLFPKSSA